MTGSRTIATIVASDLCIAVTGSRTIATIVASDLCIG